MIHVCFSLHDKTGSYSKFTGTALLSLFESMNTPPSTCIHLLHDNTLTNDNRDKFVQIANRYGQPLKFYNVEELCADRLAEINKYFSNVSEPRFSVAMFYRLLIPHIFPPDVEKAIYLDSDIIVNLDITELWQLELGNKPFGAVPNLFQMKDKAASIERTKKIIPGVGKGLIKPEDYFNSGVLLMNLKVLREEEVNISAGIKFRGEHPELRFYDQEILNYCFSTTYLKLPVKFNRYVMLARPENEWTVEKKIYHYAHMKGSLGADMDDPFNHLWMSYFIRTPWFETNDVIALSGESIPYRKNYAVSVIIPMFNAEKYIGECLHSILWQTLRNFEVIVVDDCSTDNSVEVVKSYMPKFNGRLKLDKTEKNSGGGGTPRNIGLKQVCGEYIFFVDADDYIDKTALETLYKAAKEHNADVVYNSAYYNLKQEKNFSVYRDGSTKNLSKKGIADEPTLIIDNPNKILQQLITEGMGVDFHGIFNKFIRRDFLIGHEIFFPAVALAEDYIWCIEIYCHAKRFLRLPVPLYFYRRYTGESVTTTKRTLKEQINYWFSDFIQWLNILNEVTNRLEILKDNPAYGLGAARSHFNWCLDCTREEREQLKLTDRDIYDMIYSKFAGRNDLADFVMPFLSSTVNKEKVVEKPLQNFYTLKEEIDSFKRAKASPSDAPTISVIIPMYNVEKYIGECLESLLAQTFQDFEVIVVDDGSTDLSCSVVESYIPKFNARLSLYPMGENAGQGERRNFGLSRAHGEYVYFMDSDDVLIKTGLGEMYSLAQEHAADVVYCERYYMSEGVGEDFIKNVSVATAAQSPPYVDEPTLEPEDLSERIPKILDRRFFPGPVFKLVRRDLLNEHKIFFPAIKPGEDDIWTYALVFFAKKFLRVPNMIYIRRMRKDSVTGVARSSEQAMSFWLTPTLLGLKELDKLLARVEFFQQNPQQRYAILENRLKRNYEGLLKYAGQCNSIDIYETIKRDFNKYLGENDLLISVLCSQIFEQNKRADMDSICPQVSIVISMYNAEKYIGELLDSILAQTFKDFEVIVVDDCSTDNSFAVVKSYLPNFSGRMKLAKTQTNSGRPGEPRNIGVDLSRGKYLLILDSDDTITPDALEKLYKVAKDFNADVVACEKFYKVPEEIWNNLEARKQLEPKSYQKGGFVSEPTLVPFDIAKRVQEMHNVRFLYSLWSKLIRRELWLENQIHSQSIVNQDMLATCCLVLSAKRIVRVPYVINYYRVRKDSIYQSRIIYEPLKKLKVHMEALNVGFKYLERFLNKREFFRKNPKIKHQALKIYFRDVWNKYLHDVYDKVPAPDLKAALREEFSGSDNAEFIAFLFETLNELEERKGTTTLPPAFKPFVTARFDIKLLSTAGDFKIISVSDKKANVSKPAWAQYDGIGYSILSHVGNLEIIAKATVNGKINLRLRGMDVHDPENKSKRIPYWIDYTSLTINGKNIFDKLTPAWHDKPYIYTFDVKADDEIKIETKWLPHRSDVATVSAPPTEELPPRKIETPKVSPPPQKVVEPVDKKRLPYFTARVDVNLVTAEGGDFQIVSVSDDNAAVRKATWLPKNEIGYVIQSHKGSMAIVAKAVSDGKLVLSLRSMDVRNPKDNKRIPYWIDYTSLTVNAKKLFDEVTPVWHDKPYKFTLNIKAGDEVKIQVEWLPHKSST